MTTDYANTITPEGFVADYFTAPSDDILQAVAHADKLTDEWRDYIRASVGFEAATLSEAEVDAALATLIAASIPIANLARIEDAYYDCTGRWTGADWTHETKINGDQVPAPEHSVAPGVDPGPMYCSGDIKGCEYCRDAKRDAEVAEAHGREALEFAKSKEWAAAATAAGEAASLEHSYGDDPTWCVLKDACDEVVDRLAA